MLCGSVIKLWSARSKLLRPPCPKASALLCCRVLSVYLMWSLVVQLGCTLWVVYREGGELKQLGMHMLVLTANNTGIIGASS